MPSCSILGCSKARSEGEKDNKLDLLHVLGHIQFHIYISPLNVLSEGVLFFKQRFSGIFDPSGRKII